MYTFTYADYLDKNSGLLGGAAPSGSLWCALSTVPFNTSMLDAHRIKDLSSAFVEYMDPDLIYARQKLQGVSLIMDGTYHRWRLSASDTMFGKMAANVSGPCQYALVYQGGPSTAVVAAGGTGYSVGDTLTIVGGVHSTVATFSVVSVSGGAVTSVASVTDGSYTTLPANPTATSGGGSGATLTVTWLDNALPRWVIDNNATNAFPFNGDGSKAIRIRWSPAGVVNGPNCTTTTQIALNMADSQFLAERYS